MAFYIILAALVAAALVLIFRDDHDRSYSRKEKSREARPAAEPQKEPAPAATPQVAPAVQAPPQRKYYTRKTKLSWTYLYGLEYDDSLDEDAMDSEIAGLNHYVSEEDFGPVNGIVRPEPDNPKDPRAQVVIRSDGKKLGYIPRTELDDYEDFNEDNLVCPFSGEIIMSEEGFFSSYIHIALPVSRDFVKEELSDYMEEEEEA